MDLRKVFDCMISVSELGRGQASKVIQAVEDFGNPFIVVKNNKPLAVIVSINEYTELMRSKDMLDAMRSPIQSPNYASFASAKVNSLTEDEINIFLQSEESD
ncbi:MAG: hypothetical protein AWM53_01331 [Candidatus Dichloromethanomonas elyunquensis]|nr:MAG: hypothetical protein AWM53_01331 [Candidatus Dichloromethanomonas elyunquensis]